MLLEENSFNENQYKLKNIKIKTENWTFQSKPKVNYMLGSIYNNIILLWMA